MMFLSRVPFNPYYGVRAAVFADLTRFFCTWSVMTPKGVLFLARIPVFGPLRADLGVAAGGDQYDQIFTIESVWRHLARLSGGGLYASGSKLPSSSLRSSSSCPPIMPMPTEAANPTTTKPIADAICPIGGVKCSVGQ